MNYYSIANKIKDCKAGSGFFTAANMFTFMPKDPFNEQVVICEKLLFFTLQSNVIIIYKYYRINDIQEW